MKLKRRKEKPSVHLASLKWWSAVLNIDERLWSLPLRALAAVTVVVVAEVDGEDLSRCLSRASLIRLRSATTCPISAATALDPPPLLYISFPVFCLLLLSLLLLFLLFLSFRITIINKKILIKPFKTKKKKFENSRNNDKGRASFFLRRDGEKIN